MSVDEIGGEIRACDICGPESPWSSTLAQWKQRWLPFAGTAAMSEADAGILRWGLCFSSDVAARKHKWMSSFGCIAHVCFLKNTSTNALWYIHCPKIVHWLIGFIYSTDKYWTHNICYNWGDRWIQNQFLHSDSSGSKRVTAVPACKQCPASLQGAKGTQGGINSGCVEEHARGCSI